jgi:hypothetical protein
MSMISRTLLYAMLFGVGSTVPIVSLAPPTAAWVAAVPSMARPSQQNESVVELAQVLKGPRANCRRRCGYRYASCRQITKASSCSKSYNRCMVRCETPGGPPLYPPPSLR